MEKCFNLLNLYDRFKQNEDVRLNVICGEFNISESTFHRYIENIRNYVWEKYKQEIVFFKCDNCYRLVDKKYKDD